MAARGNNLPRNHVLWHQNMANGTNQQVGDKREATDLVVKGCFNIQDWGLAIKAPHDLSSLKGIVWNTGEKKISVWKIITFY